MKNNTTPKKIIPVFFAADDKYVPFLAVTLQSMSEFLCADNEYRIHVLHEGLSEESKKSISKYQKENMTITYADVSAQISTFASKLKLRDYYTNAIYFRLFIAQLFPQYDKAIYLDCDIVIRCDLAELYDTSLENAYLAAVPDGAVGMVPVFQEYTKKVLGINGNEYFNSGVMLLNLNVLRREGFYDKFSELIARYGFIVAPDQDCLNVICKNRIVFLSDEWNTMPIGGEAQRAKNPKIVHYNLTMKPWHYENILYREYFWANAEKTEFYDCLKQELQNYGNAEKERDKACEAGLLALCQKEIDRTDNYYNVYVKE